MFSKKFKSLLVFALVLILTCSFTVLVNAEDTSNVSSAASQSSTSVSQASNASESSEASVSSVASTVSSDSSVSDVGTTASKSNLPGWLGWAIAGGVILIIALWIFIAIKRNTPFGQKVVKFFRDYKSEIKKVVWLSKEDLVKKTCVVLVTIIVSCIVLGLLDWGFTKLISLIK